MSQNESFPVIVGVGAYLPERIISNQDLIRETGIDSTPEWIEAHTGIEARHRVAEGEHASDMALAAARDALRMATVEPAEISSIHLAVGSPDYQMPSVCSMVHAALRAREECLAVDLRAACAGFIVGLEAASDRIQSRPGGSNALVIGSEVTSARMNINDRRSAILFGDGAGAVVVQSRVGASRPVSVMLTQPNKEAVYVPAGGTVQPSKGPDDPDTRLLMNGPMVKEHALSIMPRAAQMVADRAGLVDTQGAIDWTQIDLFVPHQANRRLIEVIGKEIGVPEDKCVITVDPYANTSSASIPMALAVAHQEGRLRPGRNRVLFSAIGAGMVGGAMLIDVELPA